MHVMNHVKNGSLRRKLVGIIMLSCMACLMVSLSMIGVSSAITLYQTTVRELIATGELLSQNAQAALAFNDYQEAQRLLDSLQQHPEIVEAWMISRDGEVLASWCQTGVQTGVLGDVVVPHRILSSSFWDRRARLFTPVIKNDEVIGNVVLEADRGGQWRQLWRDFSKGLLVALLALLIVLILVLRLQRIVSRPIEDLAKTALRIAEQKDYGLRVSSQANDEIGDLIAAFNTMLAEIQMRDELLIQNNEYLEQEVLLRTKEFLDAKQVAERAVAAKSLFLANMSHEVRTPMNAIIGLSRLLLTGELSAKQRDYLLKIRKSSEALLSITNDILDYSKIEAGHLKMVVEPFVLAELLNEVMGLFRPRAEEKALTLTLELKSALPKIVIGDALRLAQVLNNLVDNAIKFTETGKIDLVVEQTARDYAMASLRFDVCDTGIGMTSEQMLNLFQAFTQADESITRRFGGTGLGLAISKQLVTMMGGELTVQSQAAQGSVFSICLSLPYCADVPVQKAQVDAVVDDLTALASGLQGVRILLVEDNEVNQLLVCEYLEAVAMQVDVAENGCQAIEMLESAAVDYDLVLMDLQMPIMDGFEATRIIRQQPRFSRLPIIAMTASAMANDRALCLSCGMNEHIAKPIDWQHFFQVLQRFFPPPSRSTSILFPQGNKTAGFPRLSAVDFELARQLCDNNAVLYRKLLEVFYRQHAGHMAASRKAYEEGDSLAAAQQVHQFNGGVCSVGAVSLSSTLKALEQALLCEDSVGIQRLLELAEHESSQLLAEVRDLLT